MKQRQLFQKPILAFFLLFSLSGFSQVNEAWVKRYSTANEDHVTAMTIDSFGNVYVTGYSLSELTEFDYLTVKYDAAGNEVWIKRYADGDVARAIAVDASGNVYVTGQSIGKTTNYDYATVKYDAAGNELWMRRYNGLESSADEARSLVLDASGNVYVTGTSYNNGYPDYATIKYDAAGNEQWVRRYNGPGNEEDQATSLAVDGSGNVYVTGYSWGSDTTGHGYATIKYDAAGKIRWIKRYDKRGGYNIARDMAIDAFGNVYVTGYSIISGVNYDYATIKYDASGNELWIQRYDGPANDVDYVSALVVDAFGNVYVTGQSYNPESHYDYATVKYDAGGAELWVRRYNGPANSADGANALALDTVGNVYVTGFSEGIGTERDYTTIKYEVNGAELWAIRYNGTGNSYDDGVSIATDASGNVYVAGSSLGDRTSFDYATIKYSQTTKQSVSSFTLINADTDKDIRELKDGDTINLETLSTLNLNIRANTDPVVVGSVAFRLSGAETRNYTENITPYALFADNKSGDYYPWAPKIGNYTLTATPYSATKGGGTKGTPFTIHFSITGTVINSLILVNAETDKDIKTLKNGTVIDLATLPTTKLNIRAVVHPDTVGSVVFNLNNRMIVRENIFPYAIGGDIKGDYRPWSLPLGNHVLTATPYQGSFGGGRKGKAHSVSFKVIDTAPITHMGAATPEKPITPVSLNSRQVITATPNPFSGRTMIHFSVPKSGYVTVQVYDITGSVKGHLYQAWAEGGKLYQVPFESKQLPKGVYLLQVAGLDYIQSYKLVLTW